MPVQIFGANEGVSKKSTPGKKSNKTPKNNSPKQNMPSVEEGLLLMERERQLQEAA